MEVRYHRRFRKQYRKLMRGERERFAARLALFIQDSHASVLDNHPLTGKYLGCHSIDITGDVRAIYITDFAPTLMHGHNIDYASPNTIKRDFREAKFVKTRIPLSPSIHKVRNACISQLAITPSDLLLWAATASYMSKMGEKIERDWQEKLTPEQYEILRLKGTEAPFTGQYVDHHQNGTYTCAA